MEMPKIYVNPPRSEWPALTARCTRQEEEIGERVAAILAEVRTEKRDNIYRFDITKRL